MEDLFIIDEANGCAIFQVKTTLLAPFRWEFEVYSIVSWQMDNTPILEDNELYLKGIITGDGCSHVWFGYDDGYLHLCGSGDWLYHNKLMQFLIEKAADILPDFEA